MFDDEDPKEWEVRDEEPPEVLKRKWESEESAGLQRIVCPSCKKETLSGSLTCIFCGATILREYCVMRRFVSWVQRLFRQG